MVIDIRVNVPMGSVVDLGQIRELVVCALSAIGHGKKKGMSMIAGAGVAWRVTRHEEERPADALDMTA